MSFFSLGFVTGLSLILAIGAQNIFVIEQGLKKQYIFTICLICSLSDTLLIFSGILIFNFFINLFTSRIEIILNFLLLIFLLHFVYRKFNEQIDDISFNKKTNISNFKSTVLKTLGFTYLNPHVYSDTVFFLGNFSKNFYFTDKLFFALGASLSSFIFFYTLGYLSKFFSKYLQSKKVWHIINKFIIGFMILIILYVIKEILVILI